MRETVGPIVGIALWVAFGIYGILAAQRDILRVVDRLEMRMKARYRRQFQEEKRRIAVSDDQSQAITEALHQGKKMKENTKERI